MQTTPREVDWNALVAQSLSRVSTPTSCETRGRKPLRIKPEAVCLAQREVRRTLGQVDPRLRMVFRGLVTGLKPWPLYLWGAAGTGKTSAALVVLDHCGRNQSEHEFLPAVHDWLYGYAEVRSLAGLKIKADRGLAAHDFGVPDGCSSWDRMLYHWGRLPVVLLDEIGVGAQAGDFKLDTLLEVLNTRCNDPVKPLIVTGNLSPEDLPVMYDDRVSSRALAGTVYRLGGNDRRIAK